MRIEQLRLDRYGKFTDQTLDFGPARPGKPDLHLVLGPNEAGKTTTLNAWLDLLYGMGLTNAYAYLHGYDAMRVGARLAINGATHDYVRLKRNKNSLFDGSGGPVSDEALLQAMNGLSRAAYANMFSMDSRALEEGGREALESRGQLGEMLYAASAGIGAVSATLTELQDKADGFWKPRSRKSALAQLKAQLMELREQRAGIDITEAMYSRRKKQLETADASYQQAAARMGQLEQRLKLVGDLLSALVVAPKLAVARAGLAALPAFAPAPADWGKRAGQLLVADAETRTRLQALREQETELARRLAALPRDAVGLALADDLEQARLLQIRHAAAIPDIPRLRHDLELTDRQLTELVRQLDQPADVDAAALRLPNHVIISLRELVESRTVLDAQSGDATRELEEARLALADLTAGEALPPDSDDEARIARLAALVDDIRQQAFDRRISTAQRHKAHADQSLAQRLQLLAPWRGDAGELAALATPAATVLDDLSRARADAARQMAALNEAIVAADDDLQRLAAELDGIAAVTGAADDGAHVRARAQREQAWAVHRSALTADTADAFADAMRHDDMVAETRLTRQAELAKAAELRQQQAKRASQREQLLARRQAAEEAIAELEARVRALAAGVSPALGAFAAPDELADWLHRRAAALDARGPALDAAHELAEAEAQRAMAVAALRRLLPAETIDDADLPELLDAAQTLIGDASRRRQRRDAIVRATTALEQRRRAASRIAEAVAVWDARWRAVCGACWLGGDAGGGEAAPTPTRVRAALDLLGPLEKLLLQRQDLATRIAKMERDQKLFADAVTTLAQRLDAGSMPASAVATPPAPQHAAPEGSGVTQDLDAMSSVSTDAASLFRKLEARAEAARDSARQREALQEAVERNQQELREVMQARARLDAEVSQMARHFGVDSIVEIQSALETSDRREGFRAQVADIEQQLMAFTGAPSPEEADRLLADADRPALTAEQATLSEERRAVQAQMQELYAEKRKAEQALAAIAPDSAVAQLDAQRQALLLEIADKAQAWLRLRLGVAAAERGLSLWRENHRSALLRHASAAFSHMSCGAWAGLEAHPGPSGEMLMAVDHNRIARRVEHLSKGARFQLYLALRIAAYEDFAATRTPPPFVADDILETFDDDRAAATFELLGAMAGHGQVIYLTHHAHLCEIASARCPDVLIHKLSGAPIGDDP